MTNIVYTNNVAPFKFAQFVDNPRQVGQELRIAFDFSTTTSYELDLTPFWQQHTDIGAFKTVFIDNADNSSPVSITSLGTNQRVVIGANQQGFVQLMCIAEAPRYQVQSAGGVTVAIHFINKTIPSFVWNSLSQLQVSVINNVPTYLAGSAGTGYNNNIGATPANLIISVAANTTRKCYEIQNQSVETLTVVLSNGAKIILDPAAAVGSQGGGWKCAEYKGTIAVYSSSATSQVTSYEV